MIVRAEWPDGTAWSATLGTLEVTAIDGETGRRLAGAEVRLRNTNMKSVADDHGIAHFADVFPGRYAIEVVNAQLDSLGLGSSRSGVNAGDLDSVVVRRSQVQADTTTRQLLRRVDVYADRTARQSVPMVTTKQFADLACRNPGTLDSPKRAILGRVVHADGRAADSATVVAEDVDTSRRAATQPGGFFVLCVPDTWAGRVTLVAQRGSAFSAEVTIELGDRVTFARLGIRP
jgi:hypothetical protein